MISDATVNKLLLKLSKLKQNIAKSEETQPYYQLVVDFMRDIIPVLKTINFTVTDSTIKIPNVSNQISSVTNATELATNEILDIVDHILEDLDRSEKFIVKLKEEETLKFQLLDEASKIIDEHGSLELKDSYKKLFAEDNKIDGLFKAVSNIKNNIHNITLSLQVQDITAQQLISVNALVQSVHNKLSVLLLDMEDSDNSGKNASGTDDAGDFVVDADARYSDQTERQKIADNLFLTHMNKV